MVKLPLRHVVHLIKSLGRGGAEVLLIEGLSVADRSRFNFGYGYFLPWKNALVEDIEAQGAKVVCFGSENNVSILLAARRVARYLCASDADVVHAHLPLAGIVARVAGWLARVPVVYTEHNVMERYHPLTHRLNVATWFLQAQAIAVSIEVEESIRRHAGDHVPVRTVTNGVNVRSYDPGVVDGSSVRAKWGIPSDAFVVGTVAVFRKQKRLEHWLEVARRVADGVAGVHFLLVGDGPLRREVEAGIVEQGLQAVAHLAGLQEETRPYFAAVDAYLMTSQFEGLPVALLEAMSMAVPPVVTAVGGIPEVVVTGKNGYARPYGAIEALADDIILMAKNEEVRRGIGAEARRTVVGQFSIERMQGELEVIYERVIAEHQRRKGKL